MIIELSAGALMRLQRARQDKATMAVQLAWLALHLEWFGTSPDAGDPACICSLCGKIIPDDGMPIVRQFRDPLESRFHTDCWKYYWRTMA